jgi:hypothetical protein
MAFPIIPKRRSGSAGNPTTLQLGELAVNTLDGELYLGGDGGVMLLNGPVAAGTTATEHTGDGTTVAFTFGGYNGTADGGYIVSVGGIDQPPSKYSITNTAGGTLTFVEAPVTGELISIRAIVAGSGGGGGGDATSIQGVDVDDTPPEAGQVLAYNADTQKWQPASLNGSVTFNTAGTHTWAVPAWVRWVYLEAAAGDGSDGTATNGADGDVGANGYFDANNPPYNINATTGANGADGTASAGSAGANVFIIGGDIVDAWAGGAAGQAGFPGFGGGGSGGAAFYDINTGLALGADGANGNGTGAGGAGTAGTYFGLGAGGAAGGEGATSGSVPLGGTGASGGGNGGNGGNGGASENQGGGGGGGINKAGGGGGGGSFNLNGSGTAGSPGKGGTADTSMCAGGTGESFAGPYDFSSVAGGTLEISINSNSGDPFVTITW